MVKLKAGIIKHSETSKAAMHHSVLSLQYTIGHKGSDSAGNFRNLHSPVIWIWPTSTFDVKVNLTNQRNHLAAHCSEVYNNGCPRVSEK